MLVLINLVIVEKVRSSQILDIFKKLRHQNLLTSLLRKITNSKIHIFFLSQFPSVYTLRMNLLKQIQKVVLFG